MIEFVKYFCFCKGFHREDKFEKMIFSVCSG